MVTITYDALNDLVHEVGDAIERTTGMSKNEVLDLFALNDTITEYLNRYGVQYADELWRGDDVVYLPSGTEISIEAAIGDVSRVLQHLRDRVNWSVMEHEQLMEYDGFISDLGHVIELLQELEKGDR